jgi:hypothetical protein
MNSPAEIDMKDGEMRICPRRRCFFGCPLPLVMLAAIAAIVESAGIVKAESGDYLPYVTKCLDTLMEFGTDRYGPTQTPVLVSILDTETRQCPADPAALDEAWRVARRGRRSPAGANLLTDQPLLKTMAAVSAVTGDGKYGRFADRYIDWYLKNLVDDKGFFWWGWHRHYDVYQDKMLGHMGNFHELHAIHSVAWDQLWQVNPKAVRREIEAIWQWHIVDKKTGELNRHGTAQRGCDFAMSAGAFAYAFAFLYKRTGEPVWLDRAKLLARYYWDRRNPATDLFPDRPNAGADRFDGSHFVTADTGLFCHALLKCYELTGENFFKDHALAYLKAYRKYGYDAKASRFWGSLQLDGTPMAGPRLMPSNDGKGEDYGVYEPRGYIDLWQPYVAGYEHPLPTAQVYAFAFSLTNDPAMLDTARLWAKLIETNLPPRACLKESWYRGYAEHWAPQGTYAGLYGQAVSFLVHMYLITGEPHYLHLARSTADDAVAKLFHNGLFRGHPASPYYEAVDGVGYLVYALLELDQVIKRPERAVSQKKIILSQGPPQTALPLDDW